jgi:hypothetical protein
MKAGRAISPPVDDGVVESWPWSDEGYEEWYFFADVPDELELAPFCNWQSMTLANWDALVGVPDAVNLGRQLESTRPRVVLGMGQKLYVISENASLIDGFLQLCDERSGATHG